MCPGAGSNHRHVDFQSTALPTELPGQQGQIAPVTEPVNSLPGFLVAFFGESNGGLLTVS